MRRLVRPTESKKAPPDDEPESWTQIGADEGADRTFVFVAHRRPESIAWNVPEIDKELMEGVDVQKGDDTFETILFMAMGVDSITQ